MQQSDAASGFTRMFLLDYGVQLLKTLTVMYWIVFEVQKLCFLNVKECSQHLFNGWCLGLGFFVLEWSGVFPLHASWFYVVIKSWHLVSFLSQCLLEMCYVQYGSAVNIPVILTCSASCAWLSVDMEPPWNISHDIRNPEQLCVQCCYSYSIPVTGNECSNCLSLCIAFWTLAVFSGLATVWACPRLDLCLMCCMDVQNMWSQSTTVVFDTHAAPQTVLMCLWISSGQYPSTPRNWITALWSCLNGFTTWYALFNLGCDVIHTNYLRNSAYCSTQVSAGVFTELNMHLHHLYCHSSVRNGWQLYMPHILNLHYQIPTVNHWMNLLRSEVPTY